MIGRRVSTRAWPVQVTIASAAANAIASDCVTSSTLRRSARSASSPPKRPKSRVGMNWQNVTIDTQNAEFVISSTSQLSATFCSQVPMFETRAPLQNSEKFRCLSGSRVRKRRRGRGCSRGTGASSTGGCGRACVGAIRSASALKRASRRSERYFPKEMVSLGTRPRKPLFLG